MAEDQHQCLQQPPLEDMKPFHSPINSNNNNDKSTNELIFNGSSNSVKPDASNENLELELEQKGSILHKPSKLEEGLENPDTSTEFSGLKLEKNGATLHKPSDFEVGSENLDDMSEYSGLDVEKKGVIFDKTSNAEVGIGNLDGKSENSELALEIKGAIYDNPSKLEVGIENLGGGSESSGLELENKGAIYDKPSKCDVGLEDNDTRSDFSGLELEKKGVMCDKPSELEASAEKLDGKGKFSGAELERAVGDVLDKKENSKVGEVCLTNYCSSKSVKCSVQIQVVEETVLVDVVSIDHKKNKRKDKKGNDNLNGGKKRCVYTRKKLESLRFVNVKGQKKFWKQVYDGFTQTVKEEYDELGCFRHHKQGQRQKKDALMSNFSGHAPVGMPAATKRWNYYNIFVY